MAGRSPRAPVAELLRPCGPSAIFGAVRPIVVDAFKGMPWRTLAHVAGESREVANPSIADVDATAAVVAKLLDVGISAALPHPTPDAIETSCRLPVSAVPFLQHIGNRTTARRSVPGTEVSDGYIRKLATNADAPPTDASTRKSVAFPRHREASEDVSRKIEFFHPVIVANNTGVCNASRH